MILLYVIWAASAGLFLGGVYVLVRNSWVCRTRKQWIHREPRPNPDPLYIFTYEAMLYRYWWCWDASYFERRAHNGSGGPP